MVVLHPMARATEVLALYRAATAKARTGSAIAGHARGTPLPIIPEEAHGAPVCGIAVSYSGPLVEGEG